MKMWSRNVILVTDRAYFQSRNAGRMLPNAAYDNRRTRSVLDRYNIGRESTHRDNAEPPDQHFPDVELVVTNTAQLQRPISRIRSPLSW